jgi:hypothetical protein
VNPLQPANGGANDAFVSKLNATGSALVFSTYLGGSFNEFGHGITVDGSGNTYVTGDTYSNNFPVANAFQPAHGGALVDAFVSKLNATGSALVYSTYLGGGGRLQRGTIDILRPRRGDDFGSGIAVDGSGNAHVTGYTNANDFPVVNPLRPAPAGRYDAFVTKFNASGSALYATYLGGSSDDHGNGIAADGSGTAYVSGNTWSQDFPVANPLQPTNRGDTDAFVIRISDGTTASPTMISIAPRSGEAGTSVKITLSGRNFISGSTAVAVSGTGITVGPVNVMSSTSLTTVLTIVSSATPAPRYVTVTTSAGQTMESLTFGVVRNPLFPGDR